MAKKPATRLKPRAPLTTDRRTGGAHNSKREELLQKSRSRDED